MNKNHFKASIAVVIATIFVSISLHGQDTLFERNGVKIYELKDDLPDYSSAVLKLANPENGKKLTVGIDTFSFELKNYKLGIQTPKKKGKMTANSDSGQCIDFILDNTSHVASCYSQITSDMKAGHHVLLAFLSNSYYESLKHKSAYVLQQFDVLDNNGFMPFSPEHPDFGGIDELAPHLFYSSPKGEYTEKDETKRVMLDFYLVNCNLSPEGYKVRATINGNEFTITKWAPYIIEGLPLGETKIKLELLDESGTPVKSPYNGTERTITLKNDPSKN